LSAGALAEIQRQSYRNARTGLRGSWPERQALDADGLAALLDRHRYCVLATARADGRAHAAPVAFARHHAVRRGAGAQRLTLRRALMPRIEVAEVGSTADVFASPARDLTSGGSSSAASRPIRTT
jgi:hypothetical protein